MGSRCPPKGPGGVQGQAPVGSGAKPPKPERLLCFMGLNNAIKASMVEKGLHIISEGAKRKYDYFLCVLVWLKLHYKDKQTHRIININIGI